MKRTFIVLVYPAFWFNCSGCGEAFVLRDISSNTSGHEPLLSDIILAVSSISYNMVEKNKSFKVWLTSDFHNTVIHFNVVPQVLYDGDSLTSIAIHAVRYATFSRLMRFPMIPCK